MVSFRSLVPLLETCKGKAFISIHNELLEGDNCHKLESTRDYFSLISDSGVQIFKAFFKMYFDFNFKAASACIGPNKSRCCFIISVIKRGCSCWKISLCLCVCARSKELASTIHLYVQTVAWIGPGFYPLLGSIVMLEAMECTRYCIQVCTGVLLLFFMQCFLPRSSFWLLRAETWATLEFPDWILQLPSV